MKGNEKDCICHKPKGKHTKNCDSYRLKNFMLKTSSIMQNNHTEDKKTIQDFIKEKGEDFKQKYYPWIMGGNGLEIKSFLTSSLQEAYELGKVEMIREVNEKIKEMYLKKPEKDRAYGNGYVKGFNQAVSIVESFLTPSSDTKDDLETNK